LYLGSKLISSGANDESIGATELAKLHDVIINAGLASKDLLVYDSTAGTNGAWVNKPLSEAISIMIGANSTSSG
jgi:MinD-like ATPase involved in chromosome partitioning or flagellar assembly